MAAAIVWVLSACECVAEDATLHAGSSSAVHIDLLPDVGVPSIRLLDVGQTKDRLQHWFRLELAGARAQAEDWLHTAGFSLLEERDPEGRHRYQVISSVLMEQWPALRLRARVGRPELSAGLRPRNELPAIGLTIPWQRYTLELEGLNDRDLGYAFMGRMRWSQPHRLVQYGLAIPLAIRHGPSIGVILQIGVRFGQ